MGLPKNYRKDLSITPHKQGFEQRQSILDDIANKGTYLPKGILHEDMDGEMVNYVNNDIDLVLNGEKVPVIFLTAQRWGEFTKTWKYTDIDKNIKLPFITIVRKPDAQQGTNYAGTFNIPGRPTFTYMKIPTWDGNRKGYDVYRIPQPISVRFIFCPLRIGRKAIVKPWLPQKRSVTLFPLISSRYTHGKFPTNLHSIPSFVILLLKSSNTFVSVSITFFFRGRTQNRTEVASFAD